jgi:hypothetical protein
MADQKITDLTEIYGDDLADGDLFEVVDVSDTSGPNAGAGGENKRITRAELVAGLATRYDWDGAANLQPTAANVRHVVLTGTLASSRNCRLPLANAVPAGAVFTFTDASGSITPSVLVFVRTSSGSSDTIDGFFDAAGSPTPTAAQVQIVRLRVPYSSVSLISDGTSKWSITNIKPAVDVQTFTANGTWQRPLGYSQARIILFGGGGGGASGRRGTSGATGGGGGGGAGGVTVVDVPLTDLPDATYTVTVGASAAGGAARTSTNNGANGTAGNVTWFSASNLWTAAGGGGGSAGTINGGGPGVGGAGMIPGAAGGTGDGSNGNQGGVQVGTVTSVPIIAPGGGGGGGWNSNGSTGFAGGTGGNTSGGVGTSSVGLAGGNAGTTTPTAGGAGTAPTTISAGFIGGGAGGGGGGSANGGTASAGGAGAAPGGGGGGGGGSNNANSGAGAAGARGACIIICW